MAILSSDGRDVDVELGELRYGERKEMLVELELDNGDVTQMTHMRQPTAQSQPRALDATDQPSRSSSPASSAFTEHTFGGSGGASRDQRTWSPPRMSSTTSATCRRPWPGSPPH